MNDVSRLSRVVEGLHTFDCHQCGKVAASLELVSLELVSPSKPVNVGAGPNGEAMSFNLSSDDELPDIRYTFIGVSVMAADADAVEILESTTPVDPLALAAIDWELGAFCCWRCELNYRSTCWRASPVFASDHPSWYEQTDGTCPAGHPQKLDD